MVDEFVEVRQRWPWRWLFEPIENAALGRLGVKQTVEQLLVSVGEAAQHELKQAGVDDCAHAPYDSKSSNRRSFPGSLARRTRAWSASWVPEGDLFRHYFGASRSS